MAEQFNLVETYDGIGKAYQDAFDHVPAQVRAIQWMISQLPKGAKVIDVGSGTGKPACAMLADAGLDVTGVDISPVMVSTAKDQVPKAKFLVAGNRTYEPSEQELPFDGVISSFALLAGMKRSDIYGFFPRAYRWLKPGGILVFGHVPMDADEAWFEWMGRRCQGSSTTTEGTLASIEKAGFQIEKHELEKYMPKGVEAGLCKQEDVWEEEHLFVYARKP